MGQLTNPPPASVPDSLSSGTKVLVVDDEAGVRESLRMLLERLGYRVTMASCGQDAVEAMESEVFDLVVTDLLMEGVDGYGVLDFAKRRQGDTPVIVLTALGSVDAAVRALKQGAYDYLLKPYDSEGLRVAVSRALENRRLRLDQRLQNHKMSAVASIAKAVATTVELSEILRIISDQTRKFVPCDSWALALLNQEDRSWDLTAVVVAWDGSPRGCGRLPIEHPFLSPLLSDRSAHFVGNLSSNTEADDWDFPFLVGIKSYILVPLVTQDRLVGALFFGRPGDSSDDLMDQRFLWLVADQVSVAVDNARLLELEVIRSRQLSFINRFGNQLTSNLTVQGLLREATRLLKSDSPYRWVDIFRFDEQDRSLVRLLTPGESESDLLKPERVPVDQGIVGRAARSGQTVLVNNVSREPDYIKAFDEASVEIAVPLKSEGRVVGVLNIEDTALNRFNQNDRSFIEAVASQISLAWNNARLFEEIRKSKVYLELVLNAAQDTAIISVSREGRIVTFNSGAEKVLGLEARQAVGSQITEIVSSARLQEVFHKIRREAKPTSWEDQIQIQRPDQKSFWGNVLLRPIEPLLGFLIIIADVTRRVQLESRLKQLTVTDDLTGLYNQRDLFVQLRREMERANRSHTSCSLCVFDLDRFKDYNDTHGHVAGDSLLRAVGGLIFRAIRAKIDRAFRYGGDEFVLLLPDTDLAEATSLVDRLRQAISGEFSGKISISAGIAEYSRGMKDKDLIESADQLMYLAKRRGGDRVEPEIAKRQTSR